MYLSAFATRRFCEAYSKQEASEEVCTIQYPDQNRLQESGDLMPCLEESCSTQPQPCTDMIG